MKTLTTKLTDRGQVSVPSLIRKQLGLQPGAKIQWEAVSETECRLFVSKKSERKGARAMLGFGKTFRPVRTTEAWMSELREGEQD